MSKHGNRAATSKSGSADVLACMPPRAPALAAVTPATICAVYARTNYAFLFAPLFHPGMRYVTPIRKQLPWRTVFNLMGPLTNPVDAGPGGTHAVEARVIGTARKELGAVFADALRMAGVAKAMVVCGMEDMDEISCAGPTLCWRLTDGAAGPEISHFQVSPADFGVATHPLHTVSPGKEPHENAAILRRILAGEMPEDDPILEFVLINTAALFVVSGICEADTSNMGPGDNGVVITERGPGGGRWKEGVRRAKWAVKSGAALRQWEEFVAVTNSLTD